MKKRILSLNLILILLSTMIPAIQVAASDKYYLPVENPGFEEGSTGSSLKGISYLTIPGWEQQMILASSTSVNLYTEIEVNSARQTTDRDKGQVLKLYDQVSNMGMVVATNYIEVPAINLTEKIDYTTTLDYYIQSKMTISMAFFNSSKQIWNGTDWQNNNNQLNTHFQQKDANGNLNFTHYMPENNNAVTYNWSVANHERTAPIGTKYLRIYVVGVYNLGGYDIKVDNVKLSYPKYTKARVYAPSQHKIYLPGWTQEERDLQSIDNYLVLSQKNYYMGNQSLKIKSETGNSMHLYSNPIKGNGNQINVGGYIAGNSVSTLNLGIRFYQNGLDGKSGNTDDRVYLNGTWKSQRSLKDLTQLYSDHDEFSGFNDQFKAFSYAANWVTDADYFKVFIYSKSDQNTEIYLDQVTVLIDGVEINVENSSFEEQISMQGVDMINTGNSDGGYLLTDDQLIDSTLTLKLTDNSATGNIGLLLPPVAAIPDTLFSFQQEFRTNQNYFIELKFYDESGRIYNFLTKQYESADAHNYFQYSISYTQPSYIVDTNSNVKINYKSPAGCAYVRPFLATKGDTQQICYYGNTTLEFSIGTRLEASKPIIYQNGNFIKFASDLILNQPLTIHFSMINTEEYDQEFRVLLVKYNYANEMKELKYKSIKINGLNQENAEHCGTVMLETLVENQNDTYGIYVFDNFNNFNYYQELILSN